MHFYKALRLYFKESMSSRLKHDFDIRSLKYLKYKLLAFLLDNNVKTISPSFSLITGVSYPQLLGQVTVNCRLLLKLLKSLSEENFLKRELVNKTIACPKCGSFEIVTRYYCPSCGSYNLDRVSLISHKTCGFIGINRDFKKADDKLVCPKCGKVLEEGSYTIMGRVFECLKCKARFDQPIVKHSCLKCHHEFDILNSLLVPVYRYVVNLDKVKAIAGEIAIELLSSSLQELSFEIVENRITGRSGIIHTFDIMAVKDDFKIGIDIVPPGTKEQDVFKVFTVSFGKIMDLSDIMIVLAIPRELSRSLPNFHSSNVNFNVIQYEKFSELPNLVKELIEKNESREAH